MNIQPPPAPKELGFGNDHSNPRWLDEKGHEDGPLWIDFFRWRVHVFAAAYYKIGYPIVKDSVNDFAVGEILRLQDKYPDHEGYLQNYFEDWNGSTTFDMPFDDVIVERAHLELRQVFR